MNEKKKKSGIKRKMFVLLLFYIINYVPFQFSHIFLFILFLFYILVRIKDNNINCIEYNLLKIIKHYFITLMIRIIKYLNLKLVKEILGP